MSSYKAVLQGKEHKRVPDNIDTNPIIIGHEFCAEVVEGHSKMFKDSQHTTTHNLLEKVGQKRHEL